ncbi:MAG: hypothetical protein E7266_10655 [Lachnospiraceae bacterium]|nr:hypothetical protein [Lachnospiraceae bacterium]
MNDIVKFINFKKKVLLGQLIGEMIAITIGEIMLAVVLSIEKTSENYFQVGTMMGLIAVFFIVMLTAVFSANDFNLLMSMCFTRKKFFGLNLLYHIVTVGLTTFVAFISLLVTGVIHKAAYSWVDFNAGDDISGFFYSGYVLLFAVAVVTLCQIVTVVMIKYQNKGYAIMWALMMLCSLGIPRLTHFVEKQEGTVINKILSHIGDVMMMYNGFLGAAIGCAVAIVLIVISGWVMRKQQVTL